MTTSRQIVLADDALYHTGAFLEDNSILRKIVDMTCWLKPLDIQCIVQSHCKKNTN